MTWGYKGLQWVKRDYRGYKELDGVSKGLKG